MKKHTNKLAVAVIEELRKRGLRLATAESCTGGAVASAITMVPGCSDTFMGAIVAYSNSVKSRLLNVREKTLEEHGAVSEETIIEMANGATRQLGTECAIATSGIAGPGGGTIEKPVGTVWIAAKTGNCITTKLLRLGNRGRKENIAATVEEALELILGSLRREEER